MPRSRDDPIRVESMHSLHFIILSLFPVLHYIPKRGAGRSKGYDLPMVRDWQGVPNRISRSKRLKDANNIVESLGLEVGGLEVFDGP